VKRFMRFWTQMLAKTGSTNPSRLASPAHYSRGRRSAFPVRYRSWPSFHRSSSAPVYPPGWQNIRLNPRLAGTFQQLYRRLFGSHHALLGCFICSKIRGYEGMTIFISLISDGATYGRISTLNVYLTVCWDIDITVM
jgi:hypothetical protein